MPIEFVNINSEKLIDAAGQLVVQAVDPRSFEARPKTKTERHEWHGGFVVEGHHPGSMEEAREFTEKAFRRWLAMTADEQKGMIREGKTLPRPWDEAKWRKDTKLKRVGRPYSIPEAASACAQMAERSGWSDVSVRELKKE